MKALLFAGTTEGRQIAASLIESGIESTAWFATAFGLENSGLASAGAFTAECGRLDQEGIKNLIESRGFTHVIDATHPYAVIATENIRGAAESTGAICLRVLRKSQPYGENSILAPDIKAACRIVSEGEGNCLVTTGFKELYEFASVPSYQERVFARFLPQPESLQKALDMGFNASNLILAKGPFSERMNLACLEAAKASFIVTKASGEEGGFSEKLSAAEAYGAKAIVVARPVEEEGLDVGEALMALGIKSGMKTAQKAMFPIFINIEGKKAIFIGGGKVASRRVQTLMGFGAEVTVASPEIDDKIMGLFRQGRVSIKQKDFELSDLKGYDIAIACTNSPELNHKVVLEAKRLGIMHANNASDSKDSSFFFPAVIHWGDATIAIASDAGPGSHERVKRASDMARSLFGKGQS